MTRAALAIVLIMVSVAVLAANTFGGHVAHVAARVLFVTLCLLGLRSSTIREVLLLTAALILSAFLLPNPDGRANLLTAIDLAAYFAAFIALLTALKIAAERSRSVLAVGRYLIRQPAGRRFIATASGGHILGVFLNFGAVSLMAPLIQSATKHPDGTTDRDLERRQMSALLRGFAWILLWAPTTLAQAVLLTLFTEIDLGKIITLGIATSLLMMAIGLAYDRFEWRGQDLPAGDDMAPELPRTALFRLGIVCSALIGATAAIQLAAGYTTALSLMFVAPTVTLLWFGLQRPEETSLTTQLASFWPALKTDAAGLARSPSPWGCRGSLAARWPRFCP